MNYKIVEKESFTVLGAAKVFEYQNCKEEIPVFSVSVDGMIYNEVFGPCLSEKLCGHHTLPHCVFSLLCPYSVLHMDLNM